MQPLKQRVDWTTFCWANTGSKGGYSAVILSACYDDVNEFEMVTGEVELWDGDFRHVKSGRPICILDTIAELNGQSSKVYAEYICQLLNDDQNN
jgi:cobalamin biosynthesis Co2+ chelatase CbiK